MKQPMTHPRPTEGELAILRVLWSHGPSTVRVVHEALRPQRPVGYTTVLKMLQIMLGKGIVSREATRRPHIYAAARARGAVQDSLVDALVHSAFGGSATRLAMRALAAGRPSADDLADLRCLLDALDASHEAGEDARNR